MPVRDIAKTLCNQKTLASLGFNLQGYLPAPEAPLTLGLQHWENQESTEAQQYFTLVIALIASRVWTQSIYSLMLPYSFAGVLHSDPEVAAAKMDDIKTFWHFGAHCVSWTSQIKFAQAVPYHVKHRVHNTYNRTCATPCHAPSMPHRQCFTIL